MWAEEQDFADNDWWLGWLEDWAKIPHVPLTSSVEAKSYGDVVWNHYLTARFGRDVIRTAREQSAASGSFAPGAFTANYKHLGGRVNHASYFAPSGLSDQEYETSFDLEARLPRGTAGGIALVGNHGPWRLVWKFLPRGGPGSVRVSRLPAPPEQDAGQAGPPGRAAVVASLRPVDLLKVSGATSLARLCYTYTLTIVPSSPPSAGGGTGEPLGGLRAIRGESPSCVRRSAGRRPSRARQLTS